MSITTAKKCELCNTQFISAMQETKKVEKYKNSTVRLCKKQTFTSNKYFRLILSAKRMQNSWS